MEFFQSLIHSLGLTPTSLVTGGLVYARMFGLFSVIPNLSSEFVPGLVRGVFTISLVPFAVATAMPTVDEENIAELEEGMFLILLLMKEVAFGLLIGFLISLPLRILSLVGDVIDNQRGAAIAESFNPSSGDQTALLGQFLSQVVFVYFLVNGGLQFLINFVLASFTFYPIDQLFSFEPISGELFLALISEFLRLFMVLAMPVMLAMFIAEMGLALSSRFAQAINVYTLAQPVKSGVAIVLIFYMLLDIITRTYDYMGDIGEMMFDVPLVAPGG